MAHDPFDLQGQERSRQEREDRDKLTQRVEADDLKWLMKNKQGRRIAWRLLEQSGVYRVSFNQNAMTMAFNEGNRNLGLVMLGKIHELCPDQYTLMVQEQRNGRSNSSSGTD